MAAHTESGAKIELPIGWWYDSGKAKPMAGITSRPEGPQVRPPPADRLDSWKEIAAYLRRAERTVRRWERLEGLPVRRHVHEKRGSVYAYREEVDAWWSSRAASLERDGQDRLPLWKIAWRQPVLGVFLAAVIVVAGIVAWRMAATRKAPQEVLKNPEAYELYLQGRHLFDQFTSAGYKQATDYFERALAKDPNYAPAYVGLADVYLAQGGHLQVLTPKEAVAKAKRALAKSLELGPPSWEAHLAAGRLKSEFEWDWAGAEWEYQRAIQLNPGAALARSWYGRFLARVGRSQESIREHQIALRLDPVSASARVDLAESFYFARRYTEVIEQCQKVLELHPRHWGAYIYLTLGYERLGHFEKAIAATEQAVALNSDKDNLNLAGLSGLGYVYAAAGRQAEAQKLLDKLLEESGRRYVSPMAFAQIHLGLGNKDQVFHWLEKGYAARDPMMLYMKEPYFDSLHSDPRYTALLRKMRL